MTWYFSNVIGRKLGRPRTTETLPACLYRGTLETRVGEGGRRRAKKSIYALVSVRTLRQRLRPFQTRPGTFQTRLAGSLTGRGRQKDFPTSHTEVHHRRVLAGRFTPPTTNSTCASVLVGTFQTRPGTFGRRLTGRLTKQKPRLKCTEAKKKRPYKCSTG